jgi:hypothetical protein
VDCGDVDVVVEVTTFGVVVGMAIDGVVVVGPSVVVSSSLPFGSGVPTTP